MSNTTTATATVTDPVCGMTIDPARALASSTYNGRTYSFCSRGCETRFNLAPDQYAIGAEEPAESTSCCSTGHSCC